ncbi:hypothetical protein C8039_04000 [Halogeometricum sp. wsp3]|nr:hypothetical protein C8039_04000 [Halogeometricum sp. wsp3]
MNPVPVMKGVELVVGEKTSDETVTLGRELPRHPQGNTGSPTTSPVSW